MDYFDIDLNDNRATSELVDIFETTPLEIPATQLEDDIQVVEEIPELDYDFSDLLSVMRKHDASDLHIKEGSPPMVRMNGDLFPIGDYKLTDEDCARFIMSICNVYQQQFLLKGKEVDIAYDDGGSRYRINAYLQKSSLSASIRMLRTDIPSFEEISLPPQLGNLVLFKHGLVIVTGPAGTGKSTTLAAMIDHINKEQSKHIITIEDPIEYLHTPSKCLISQREVGADTLTFTTGLKYALRQDPDVILIGEMRDPDTVFTALQAAETGHLVLSSLHTPNTVQSINRILDVFTGENQKQIRLLLASNLKGVVSQRLIPRMDGEGRVPAIEIMVLTPTISSLIVEEKIGDIYPYISQGKSAGMMTMNQSLYLLYRKGIISYDDAMRNSDQQTEMRMLMDGHSSEGSSAMDDILTSWL